MVVPSISPVLRLKNDRFEASLGSYPKTTEMKLVLSPGHFYPSEIGRVQTAGPV